MLASNNRLKRARDISRVSLHPRLRAYGPVAVKAAPNGGQDSRVVIVVSKKISKKAVVRNQNRRRVSGVLEVAWETVLPGYDIVVSVRQDLGELGSSELAGVIQMAFTKAGLMK